MEGTGHIGRLGGGGVRGTSVSLPEGHLGGFTGISLEGHFGQLKGIQGSERCDRH